ncbi:MAG: DUF2155 domain-containing protein [Pseudomonadota bacterium]
MKALGLVLVAALACPPVVSAQTVETQPLDAPQDPAEGERSSRFQRAPFKTYLEKVGPSLPRAIEQSDTTQHQGVLLRQLDKMTGGIQTIQIRVGDEIALDRLRIRVDDCRTEDPGATEGAIALMKIWDIRSEQADPDFSGWMFAESPALSALDHPRYDVWVLNCIATSGGTASANE